MEDGAELDQVQATPNSSHSMAQVLAFISDVLYKLGDAEPGWAQFLVVISAKYLDTLIEYVHTFELLQYLKVG